jgi:hypothetical protein
MYQMLCSGPIALTDAGDGVFTVPMNTVVDMVQMDLMQAEGFYTNFHTTQNPVVKFVVRLLCGFSRLSL